MSKFDKLTPEQNRFLNRILPGPARSALMSAISRGATIFELVEPRIIFERDGWRCKYCNKTTPPELQGKQQPDSPTLDHVIPIGGGHKGSHTYQNCQCLCRVCNVEKLANLSEADKKAWADRVKQHADELVKPSFAEVMDNFKERNQADVEAYYERCQREAAEWVEKLLHGVTQ